MSKPITLEALEAYFTNNGLTIGFVEVEEPHLCEICTYPAEIFEDGLFFCNRNCFDIYLERRYNERY